MKSEEKSLDKNSIIGPPAKDDDLKIDFQIILNESGFHFGWD